MKLLNLSNKEDVNWYFGCHGSHDLDNLNQLLKKLKIDKKQVSVFRTDGVRVALLNEAPPLPGKTKERILTQNDKWSVRTKENSLFVDDLRGRGGNFEMMFSSNVNDAFFVLSDQYLFTIIRGVHAGVFLFRNIENRWTFVDELESKQGVINQRLSHVFLTEQEILFVYNNRVRKYGLVDGKLVENRAVQDAKNKTYQGNDIMSLFVKGSKTR